MAETFIRYNNSGKYWEVATVTGGVVGSFVPLEENDIGLDGNAGTRNIDSNLNTADDGSALVLRRAHGTLASKSAVVANDRVGGIRYDAYDGASYRNVAAIRSYIANIAGSDNLSGYLSFLTRNDGAAAALTEQMRVARDGGIYFRGITSPAAPPSGYGIIYFDSATGKFNFAADLQQDPLHIIDISDDFVNGDLAGLLGWHVGGGGVTANVDSITDHIGIVPLRTGATSGTNVFLYLNTKSAGSAVASGDFDRMVWIISIPTITSMNCRFGVCENFGTAGTGGTDGIFFDYTASASAFWRTRTRKASVETINTTGVTVVAGNWYKLEIVKNGSNFDFYINDVFQFTHSTNIPIIGLQVGFAVQNSTAADRNVQIDFFRIKSRTLGSRFT